MTLSIFKARNFAGKWKFAQSPQVPCLELSIDVYLQFLGVWSVYDTLTFKDWQIPVDSLIYCRSVHSQTPDQRVTYFDGFARVVRLVNTDSQRHLEPPNARS